MRGLSKLVALVALPVIACRWFEPLAATEGGEPPASLVMEPDAVIIVGKATKDNGVDRMLEQLSSDDQETRKSGRFALSLLRINPRECAVEQGIRALKMAARVAPRGRVICDEDAADLVAVIGVHPRPEFVPIVVDLFDQYSERVKPEALTILTGLPQRETAETYMKLVQKHVPTGKLSRLGLRPLEATPRHPDVYFPGLLRFVTDAKLSDDVCHATLSYCNARLLTTSTLAPFAGDFVNRLHALDMRLRPAQRAEGIGWMWDEEYSTWREQDEVLLDLLGYFPASNVEDDLRRTLQYRDPRLKYFAIHSLWRLGKLVSKNDVAAVAASPEMRNALYDDLRDRGNVSLYPEEYRTQAAFAESEMVRWLVYPTELGRAPDEIELMKVVSVNQGWFGGMQEYFLFRFRTLKPHWAAKNGWMAGVAGPFEKKKQPTTESLGRTFSSFESWDSKKPEEHLAKSRGVVDRAREDQIREWKGERQEEKANSQK